MVINHFLNGMILQVQPPPVNPVKIPLKQLLGGGVKYYLFSPPLGEMIHFDKYFSHGWLNHQLDSIKGSAAVP